MCTMNASVVGGSMNYLDFEVLDFHTQNGTFEFVPTVSLPQQAAMKATASGSSGPISVSRGPECGG